MDNRIITAINTLNRKKRIPPSSIVPIEEMDAHSVDLSTDPESYFIIKEQAEQVMNSIDESLSAFEKKVLYLSLNGDSYEDIAAETGSTSKGVDNAIQRIRRKLKKLLM